MSQAGNCNCPCPTPTVVEIPGSPGTDGAAGSPGANGVNSYTFTSADFVIPAVSSNVTVSVGQNAFMAIGEIVFIPGGEYFQVVSFPSATSVELQYVAYPSNVNSGNTIVSGTQIVPSGVIGALTGAAPADFSDNSGGTVSDVIAAGVGIQTLAFYIDATKIANGDLLTEYVPGYAFKILKFDARCAAAITTGGKASNLNLEIGTTNLTGGVVALSGTYAIGAAQAGTAVTGLNTGTSTDSFSIEASGTTAFTEGAIWMVISIQNLDVRNAFASLAAKFNALFAVLP